MPTLAHRSTSRRAALSHAGTPRARIAFALAAIVTQAGCVPIGAGIEEAEPFDESASALEMRSRTLQDVFSRVPGLSVTHGNTGRLMVRIQGGASALGSSTPLFVVDGALMPPGSIEFLNPKAIVSVEVVRNPAYTSLYGGRGANGVVSITTARPRRSH